MVICSKINLTYALHRDHHFVYASLSYWLPSQCQCYSILSFLSVTSRQLTVRWGLVARIALDGAPQRFGASSYPLSPGIAGQVRTCEGPFSLKAKSYIYRDEVSW